MTYQVLARKWRPKTFADLVGQQHVVKALQNALANGRLHHAYLLTGTRGVGKTTIARILAKSLNCENAQHGDPCGQCDTCQAIDAGRFVDLLEIDAASNTGIDNIREVLENAQYAPTAGKYKVYIIDEVHMLSKSAFNAMLKTLEEPPEHVKFILATTDPHKVPITVLSRCLQFVLRNMTAQQVSDHLAHVLNAEHIAYDPAALTLLGRAAQGSMRDALSLLDQAIAMGSGSVTQADVRQMIGAVDNRYLFELLEILSQKNGAALIAKASEMHSQSLGFDSVLGELALLLQRIALLQTVPTAIPADDPEYDRLHALARAFNGEQIQLYYQCALHGKQDLPLAPDEYAGFVMTLLRMLAFAPFTAENVPAHAVIEHTQLQEPAAPNIGSLKTDGAGLGDTATVEPQAVAQSNSPAQATAPAQPQAPLGSLKTSEAGFNQNNTAEGFNGVKKNEAGFNQTDAEKPNEAQTDADNWGETQASSHTTQAVAPQSVEAQAIEAQAVATQTALQPSHAANERQSTAPEALSGSLKTSEPHFTEAQAVSPNAADTRAINAVDPQPTAPAPVHHIETEAKAVAPETATTAAPSSSLNAEDFAEIQTSEPHLNEIPADEAQAHSGSLKASEASFSEAQPTSQAELSAAHPSAAQTEDNATTTEATPATPSEPTKKKNTPNPDLGSLKTSKAGFNQNNHAKDFNEVKTNETQTTPFPPFAAENWAAIAERISSQISAARMLLDHTAWVAYQDGELHLAVVAAKTKNTTKKEYFTRIASALSEAYQIPVHIQTQPFADGNGWETPAMHRARIAAENRAQAQALMEQDPALQAIQQHFGATWDVESIALNA